MEKLAGKDLYIVEWSGNMIKGRDHGVIKAKFFCSIPETLLEKTEIKVDLIYRLTPVNSDNQSSITPYIEILEIKIK